jgi:Zn-dependent protease/predicted transcriptional regulator
MKAQIKLGRIAGIEIGLHYSWFIIAVLITLSLVGEFHALNPEWGEGVIWTTAIATSLLFFASIVAHELSHSAVARARHLPVRAITLFALGGVAQIEREADTASTEFWMGIAGPISSALIGVLCLGLAAALGWPLGGNPLTPLQAMLMWLGYINISLAIFNLVPGFPLDGGRVLRGIIWWATGDGVRATRIAARVGQIVAFGFILIGLWRFFHGAGLGGLWIAFIGWFLMDAARASRAEVEISQMLRGVRVADLMETDCLEVDGNENLETFVYEHLLRTGKRCFLVRNGHDIEGIITPQEIKETNRARWRYLTVAEVMRPLDQLRAATPDTPVSEAMEMMAREDVNQLPVVKDGHVKGFISRGGILRLLQTRAELGM